MTTQLDIFAPRAEDVVPVEHWGKGQSGGWGPHATWEEHRAAMRDAEYITFAKEEPHYRAAAHLCRDAVTGLWIFGLDIMGRDFGCGALPHYHNGGFRDRESCIEGARVAAMKQWERHKRTPVRSFEDDEE